MMANSVCCVWIYRNEQAQVVRTSTGGRQRLPFLFPYSLLAQEVKGGNCFSSKMPPLFHYPPYSTLTRTPSEWLENSGAYMHWSVVIPFEKSPRWLTTSGYSNTNVPRGR